jgi:micrococcal nuclease
MKPLHKILLVILCIAALALVYEYAYKQGLATNKLSSQSTRVQSPAGNKKTTNNAKNENYSGEYTVAKVVDGDTIDVVKVGNNSQDKIRLRLLGVNTPESVDPSRPLECFGKEASAYVANTIRNSKVTLALDPSKPEQDKYGRVLAYVRLPDGQLLNQRIIEDGYGYEYTYHKERYQYQTEFKVAEARAKAAKLGLWSPSSCSGRK